MEFGESIAKVAPLWYSHAPFPLTPALPLREREKQGPHCHNPERLGFSNALPTMLPLPEGEGRGEGERALEIADDGSFAIGSGFWDLEFITALLPRSTYRRPTGSGSANL